MIRAVGVETGGSNVQFALNRDTGELVVIEMNPRVSRSSALASKATGYPIAKVATKLAIGYTLDEIPNDITRTTPAAFEPTLDYVVVKLPRFAFEKFPGADTGLTTQMKSVGEVMGIGRTFAEAWGKAMRSRELDRRPPRRGLGRHGRVGQVRRHPGPAHCRARAGGARGGVARAPVVPGRVGADRPLRARCSGDAVGELVETDWRRLKALGMADARIAELAGTRRARRCAPPRLGRGVRPVYKAVDSCAAEVEAQAPYFYSAYEQEDELPSRERESVIILGAGPNRIGQGIEFDYCCVQRGRDVPRLGYDAVMINCNPETVSTDADCSDRLYFEPLTVEDVLEVVEREQPLGVVVDVRRPDAAAAGPAARGRPGCRSWARRSRPSTSPRTASGSAACWPSSACGRRPGGSRSDAAHEAGAIADRIGYPVLVRP